jgi:hypothetical protein
VLETPRRAQKTAAGMYLEPSSAVSVQRLKFLVIEFGFCVVEQTRVQLSGDTAGIEVRDLK